MQGLALGATLIFHFLRTTSGMTEVRKILSNYVFILYSISFFCFLVILRHDILFCIIWSIQTWRGFTYQKKRDGQKYNHWECRGIYCPYGKYRLNSVRLLCLKCEYFGCAKKEAVMEEEIRQKKWPEKESCDRSSCEGRTPQKNGKMQ